MTKRITTPGIEQQIIADSDILGKGAWQQASK